MYVPTVNSLVLIVTSAAVAPTATASGAVQPFGISPASAATSTLTLVLVSSVPSATLTANTTSVVPNGIVAAASLPSFTVMLKSPASAHAAVGTNVSTMDAARSTDKNFLLIFVHSSCPFFTILKQASRGRTAEIPPPRPHCFSGECHASRASPPFHRNRQIAEYHLPHPLSRNVSPSFSVFPHYFSFSAPKIPQNSLLI